MSPDRDPRLLRRPDLKIAPGMLAAFDLAGELADRFRNRVTRKSPIHARIIDADTLLEPRALTHRAPHNTVEIFIDATGVLVVATGRERDKPLYSREIHIPRAFNDCGSLDYMGERALRQQLLWHAKCGMAAIEAQGKSGAGVDR